MPTRFYRLTVIGCALSWFMLGLHVPVVHEFSHGHTVPWTVVVVTVLFAVVAVAGLWYLLRLPTPWRRSAGSGPSTA